MSLCIRKISSKLPTSISTRKLIAQLDLRFQNVAQFRQNNNTINCLKNEYKRPNFLSNTTVLKIQSLKDGNSFHDYNKNILYSQLSNSNYDNNLHSGYRILENHDKEPKKLCLLSTQPSTKLKKEQTKEFGKPVPSPFFEGNSTKNVGSDPREGRPSIQQLENIKKNLTYNLPLFFVQMIDYSIYTADIVFVNNFRGTTTNGFVTYYLQSSFFKVYSHIKFIYIKFHVLKITVNPEDDSVKVRWRITGIAGSKLFTKFFKFKNPFKVKETIQREEESWFDGFSTFYINKDGKIYKHVADKMMSDSDQIEAKKDLKIPIKLAICAGFSNLDFLYSDLFTKM